MNYKLILIGILILSIIVLMVLRESFQANKIMNYAKAFFESEKTNMNNFCNTEYYNKMVNFNNPNSEINSGIKPLYGKVMAFDPLDNSDRESKI